MEEGTLDKSRSQVVTHQVMYQMHDTIQCGHGTHITGSQPHSGDFSGTH